MHLKVMVVIALFLSAPLWGPGLARSHGKEAHKGDSEYKVTPTEELTAQGKRLFRRHCAICHYSDKMESRRGPGLQGLYGQKLTPATKHPVTDANIKGHIVKGGQAMPAFGDLKPGELDALISYLKTL